LLTQTAPPAIILLLRTNLVTLLPKPSLPNAPLPLPRPISVLDTLIRLIGLALVNKHQHRLNANFSDYQFGTGKANGSETIIHSTRILFEAAKPNQATLQLDFTKAYDFISRFELHQSLQSDPANLPLLAYFHLLYASPIPCLNGSTHFSSSTGVLQGDPLAPIFFALVLHSFLQSGTIPSSALQLAFLDDLHISGSFNDLATAFNFLSQPNRFGFRLNLSKCRLLPHDRNFVSSSLPPALQQLQLVDGLIVLGTPVGSLSFCSAFFSIALSELKSSLDSLIPLTFQQRLLLSATAFSQNSTTSYVLLLHLSPMPSSPSTIS
jgi:hypothetical protein